HRHRNRRQPREDRHPAPIHRRHGPGRPRHARESPGDQVPRREAGRESDVKHPESSEPVSYASATHRHIRWLSRTVFGIGMASLCSDLSHETVTAVLPAFLASLGAAAGALGTIEGIADGFSSIAKLYGGWLADRVRRRRPLCAAGYGAMAIAPLIIAAAANWFVVLAGRVVAWISRGVRTPARKALLA